MVAVDLGPGLFTGLRVGVASAKALAHALRVPMIGVPSLDLLAFPVRFTPRPIVTCIDARRGEVFYAFYRQVPGGVQRITPHQIATPDDLASELFARGEETMLVGDGAIRYAEVFDDLERVEIAERGPDVPVGRVAGAAGPRPGAARAVGQAVGHPAALPAQARRRDQLVDQGRRRVRACAHLDAPVGHMCRSAHDLAGSKASRPAAAG